MLLALHSLVTQPRMMPSGGAGSATRSTGQSAAQDDDWHIRWAAEKRKRIHEQNKAAILTIISAVTQGVIE